MRHRAAVLAIVLLSETLVAAAAPTLAPGSCVVLVGAGAVPEDLTSGAITRATCVGDVTSATGLVGAHSVEAWIVTDPRVSFAACQTQGWVANAFAVGGAPGAQDVPARISVEGWYRGRIEQYVGRDRGATNALRARVQLVDRDGQRVLAEQEVLDASGDAAGGLTFDSSFGAEFVATIRTAHTYEVRLLVDAELTIDGGNGGLDFGLTPGSGVGYDRIEVCLTVPDDLSDIRASLGAANASLATLQARVNDVFDSVADVQTGVIDVNRKADDILAMLRNRDRQDIEWKLYNRECVPTLWLPAAQGGQAEAAQAIVADLLTAARASGEPGANVRLAESKLASATTAFADAEYQRTCKLLVDAVKAIGSP